MVSRAFDNCPTDLVRRMFRFADPGRTSKICEVERTGANPRHPSGRPRSSKGSMTLPVPSQSSGPGCPADAQESVLRTGSTMQRAIHNVERPRRAGIRKERGPETVAKPAHPRRGFYPVTKHVPDGDGIRRQAYFRTRARRMHRRFLKHRRYANDCIVQHRFADGHRASARNILGQKQCFVIKRFARPRVCVLSGRIISERYPILRISRSCQSLSANLRMYASSNDA